MADLRVDIAAEFVGRKAFKQADKAVFDLEKSAKKLAGTLGIALSAKAVVNFGKAAMKAFAEDEAAAAKLAKTVDNLGLSFANPQLAQFVDELSAATGVTDDQLRPALQALLTTTGSLAGSQKMLAQAIDIAAGSGEDLGTVAQDLANAYVGNTKGLKKYNLGLTQAELKAASFTDIQKKLNDQFSGSNAAYLKTYAGQMQLFTTAAGEAKETIGGGLIDAFKILAGDNTIGNLSDKMAKLATNIADFFRGLAQGFKDLAAMPVIKQLIQLAGLMLKIAGKVAGAVIDPFVKEGARARSSALAPSSANSHLAGLTAASNAAKSAKAEKEAKKRQMDILKAQQKAAQLAKKQLELKKAGSIFDMEQIQIIAALKGNISEEERKRLELQLALEQGNVEEAKKLTYELAIAQGLSVKIAQDLASLPAASNPFAAWKGYLDEIELQAKRIAGFGGGTPTPSPSGNVPNMPIASPDAVLARASADFAAANNQIRLIVEGGDEVTSLMRFKIQEAAQSGSTTNWSQTVGAWDR